MAVWYNVVLQARTCTKMEAIIETPRGGAKQSRVAARRNDEGPDVSSGALAAREREVRGWREREERERREERESREREKRET